MTHSDAFLRDILNHPDDDAPRLIFADWLEEQGDAASVARAEFIRVQCVLAAGQLSDLRRAELEKRENQILNEYGSQWARPIRRLVQTWEFHRGFIDAVEMGEHEFHARAIQLFSRAPIQHLRLDVNPARAPLNMAALADNWQLRNLRSLDLSANELESRDVRAFVVSEHLTNLIVLDLSHNRIGDSGIRALASSPLLGRLEHLKLRYNDIGANGLRALAHALEKFDRTPERLRLRRLEVYHNNFSVAGLRVIAESPLLRRLVRG
ncbi:MAG TPA: TIGR02996 domain-containing protein [Gemmataceae bacterium]|nr:TIGR02996 domain-containing protein [Gemmataceae bacterium]